MIGTAGARARRRRPATGDAAAVLRRPDQPRHAHRLVHRHLPCAPSDGWRLHTRSMTFLRRSGDHDSRPAPRPDRGPSRPRRLRSPRWTSTEFRAALDAWLDEHADALAPTYAGAGTRSTSRWPSSSKVKRLAFDAGWMRWGWPERVGGLGGSTLLRAYLRRGASPRRDLVEPGPLLDDRGAGADDDRLRRARAGRRDGAPAAVAATRRGARASPSPAPAATSRRCRAGPRRDGDDGWRGQRPEGVDQPRPVRAALRAAHPHRHPGVRPPRHHRVLRRHGHARDHRAADRDHARRRRVLRGVLRRRRRARSTACSATRATAGRSPWTCCPTSAARRSGSAAPTCTAGCGSCSTRASPDGALDRRGRVGRGVPSRCYAFRCPLPGHPAPAGARATRSGPRPRSTRCCWPRAEQAVFDLAADGLVAEVLHRRRPDGRAWRTEFLYSRAATIYGGTAEIQRNIIARRLLDLGSDR